MNALVPKIYGNGCLTPRKLIPSGIFGTEGRRFGAGGVKSEEHFCIRLFVQVQGHHPVVLSEADPPQPSPLSSFITAGQFTHGHSGQ